MNPWNPYGQPQTAPHSQLQVPVTPLAPPSYHHEQHFGPPDRVVIRVDTSPGHYVDISVVFLRGMPPTYVQEIYVIYVFLLRWWANQHDRPHFPGEAVKTPSMTAAGLNLCTILFTQSAHVSSRTSRDEPVHISAFVASPELWNLHQVRGEDGQLLFHSKSGDPILDREQGGLVHIFDSLDLGYPRVDEYGHQVAQWPGGPPVFDVTEHIGRGRFRIHNRGRNRISRDVRRAADQAEERSCEILGPGATPTLRPGHFFHYTRQAAPAPDKDL